MIDVILAIVTVLSSSSLYADGEALRSTVRNHAGVPVHGGDARPFPLEEAVEHVVHARVAEAFMTNRAPELRGILHANDFLSVGWHESRHDPAVSTDEGPGWWYAEEGSGGAAYSSVRWSCGVMTPFSLPRRCTLEELQIGYGYLAGARHLAVWAAKCRRWAPYASQEQVRICALNGCAGGADDRQVPGYKTWQVFVARSAEIRRAFARRPPSGS